MLVTKIRYSSAQTHPVIEAPEKHRWKTKDHKRAYQTPMRNGQTYLCNIPVIVLDHWFLDRRCAQCKEPTLNQIPQKQIKIKTGRVTPFLRRKFSNILAETCLNWRNE